MREVAGVLVPVGRSFASVYGKVLPRWVVIVRDEGGVDHYVNVSPNVWEFYQVGDIIPADAPLVDVGD